MKWLLFIGLSIGLLVAVVLFTPQIMDIADFTYVKLTHQNRPNQPLYEELHQIRYKTVICGYPINLSPAVEKYIPIGSSKNDAISILKRNGFTVFYPRKQAEIMTWHGWDKQLLGRRQYKIRIEFINGKVANIVSYGWCSAA